MPSRRKSKRLIGVSRESIILTSTPETRQPKSDSSLLPKRMMFFQIPRSEASMIASDSIPTIWLMPLPGELAPQVGAPRLVLILQGLIGGPPRQVVRGVAVVVASETSSPIFLVVVQRKRKSHPGRSRNAVPT